MLQPVLDQTTTLDANQAYLSTLAFKDIPEAERHDPIGHRRRKFGRKIAKQTGASVIVEWSLALLLTAIVVSTAYAMFSGNATDARTSNFTGELTSVVSKVTTNYAGQYANVSNTAVIGNGYFSNTQTMTANGTTINLKPGNGTLVIAPGTLVTTNDSVSWTFTNIPEGGCAEAISVLAPISGSVTVNGTAVKTNTTAYNPSLVNCGNSTNSVTFLSS